MPGRKYWLDLFTGKTWEEFLKIGAKVSGFRERRKIVAQKIHPGDYLICYLTGISRFVGVLKVKSDCFVDETPIWEDAVFPIRFKVKLIYQSHRKRQSLFKILKRNFHSSKKVGIKLHGQVFSGVPPMNFSRRMGKSLSKK